MNTIELRNHIINQIAGIQDKTVLSAIRDLIESKSTSTVYITTPVQGRKKKEDRQQASEENTSSGEQLEGETDTWCKGKMLIP